LTTAPKKISIAKIYFPDDLLVEHFTIKDLPIKWHLYPALKKLGDIGSDWARSNRSVALCVPSAQVPNSPDRNYLLNPLHPEFRKVSIEEVISYSFDKRLVT